MGGGGVGGRRGERQDGGTVGRGGKGQRGGRGGGLRYSAGPTIHLLVLEENDLRGNQ